MNIRDMSIKVDFSLILTVLALILLTSDFDRHGRSALNALGISDDNSIALIVSKSSIVLLFFIGFFTSRYLIRFVFRQPFRHVATIIELLEYRYRDYFSTRKATKAHIGVILSEIRSSFCKYFQSNEISVALFKVEGQIATLELYANEDGLVLEPSIPIIFEPGMGFCGKCLRDKKYRFDKRKKYLIFDNPDFHNFERVDDSNAYSYWNFPVFSDNERTK